MKSGFKADARLEQFRRIARVSCRALVIPMVLCAMLGSHLGAEAQSIVFNPTWVQQSPGTSPSARADAMIAYDAAHGEVVLFGGCCNGGANLSDTWTWDGTTWTERTPSTSPSARQAGVMTYDAAQGQVVLFGGAGSTINALGDTWIWNGTNWAQQNPKNSPAARYLASMDYDAAQGEAVLFGGYGSDYLSDTWTWNGTNWSQQTPASSPSARWAASMAYDAAQNQMVLFGGYGNSGFLADTWTWNGTTWTQQSPATSPSARSEAAMAYDAAQDQVVLFSGEPSAPGELDDTWTWNGTNWTQQNPLSSPPYRYAGAMVYDRSEGRVVLFGGTQNSGSLSDTWTFQIGAVDLGAANVCPSGSTTPAPCSQSATLNFTVTDETVGSIGYLTAGAPNLDFKQSSTAGTCTVGAYSTATTCTVNVTFAPTVAGERNGAVVFYSGYNRTGTVLGSVLVYGTGTGPQTAFDSQLTAATLGGGFNDPAGVAVDGSGNVYVADLGNKEVKEMPAGCASSSCVTVLGTGFNSLFGLAVDGNANVYLADADFQIQEIPAGCTSSACVISLGGGFSDPEGVAVDGSGNVYVADYGNSAVEEIPPGCASYACVTALGGGFNSPFGVAVDAGANVYVADAGNNAVYEIRAGCASSSCVVTLWGRVQPTFQPGRGREREYLRRRLRQQRHQRDACRLFVFCLRDNSGGRIPDFPLALPWTDAMTMPSAAPSSRGTSSPVRIDDVSMTVQ